MKTQNKILLITFLIISTSAFRLSAQYESVVHRNIPVILQRTIALQGSLVSTVAGASRVTIPFVLPPNTVAWYYSFSTNNAKQNNTNKPLNLNGQLNDYFSRNRQHSNELRSALNVPFGANSIDVYLLDSINQNIFLGKNAAPNTSFAFINEGTVKQLKQAVVMVNGIKSGKWALGISNPAPLIPVILNIEIIAIVEETIWVDE
ncbi:MAG: hypothetical protein IPO21_13135 [Bacteroidales bacterium]|nr:hypothetical protein [Bacteroidales bacterium]